MPDDLITESMIIPEGWGIITVDVKGKATVSRRGAQLTPAPLDTLFVCSLLRNFAESHVHQDDIEERVKKACEVAVHNARADTSARLREMEDALKKFQESSGINLLTDRGHPAWDMREIGDAVAMLVAMRSTPAEELRKAAEQLRNASQTVEAVMSTLDIRPEPVTEAPGKRRRAS